MQRIRYKEEFKAEAIKQITERWHGVVEKVRVYAGNESVEMYILPGAYI